MPVTTSRLFDFLKEHPSCSIERYEIASAAFGDLRRSLRSMIVSLAESGEWDATEFSDRLRSVLSEWLTVPVRFNDAVLLALKEMGGLLPSNRVGDATSAVILMMPFAQLRTSWSWRTLYAPRWQMSSSRCARRGGHSASSATDGRVNTLNLFSRVPVVWLSRRVSSYTLWPNIAKPNSSTYW